MQSGRRGDRPRPERRGGTAAARPAAAEYLFYSEDAETVLLKRECPRALLVRLSAHDDEIADIAREALQAQLVAASHMGRRAERRSQREASAPYSAEMALRGAMLDARTVGHERPET